MPIASSDRARTQTQGVYLQRLNVILDEIIVAFGVRGNWPPVGRVGFRSRHTRFQRWCSFHNHMLGKKWLAALRQKLSER